MTPRGFEFRFGGFAHGVGGAEAGHLRHLNGEFVTPRLPFAGLVVERVHAARQCRRPAQS